jgi:hypothetical protein
MSELASEHGLLAREIVVAVKATEQILPVHEAQPVSDLKAFGSTARTALIFNVVLIKYGIQRRVTSR